MVEKKSRRSTGHSIQFQMTMHRLLLNLLQDYTHLRVPILSDVNPTRYLMARISTRRPLILGEPDSCRLPHLSEIKQELVRLWIALWDRGYAAWDFDLFVQKDGKVILLDFDRFGLRVNNSVDLPLHIPMGSFFNHACFPTDFKAAIQDQIQEVLHF